MNRDTLLVGLLIVASFANAQEMTTTGPITRAQLDKLLELKLYSDVQTAASTHAQLEAKRKTLPAWFPKAVWDDVEHKVEAIHYADVVYPVYAKYVTSDEAVAETLLYEGPTGQKIARVLAGKSAEAGAAGLRGSAGDQSVSSELRGNEDFQSLLRQRFQELTPEQQTILREQLPKIQAVTPKIDDETHEAYRKRSNEVVQQTIAAHQAEIAKAQQNGH